MVWADAREPNARAHVLPGGGADLGKTLLSAAAHVVLATLAVVARLKRHAMVLVVLGSIQTRVPHNVKDARGGSSSRKRGKRIARDAHLVALRQPAGLLLAQRVHPADVLYQAPNNARDA